MIKVKDVVYQLLVYLSLNSKISININGV